MGEVYAAEDTRLGRKIALKVLPESFASDASRIARFEREARAASGLNHPSILTIHDFGRADESYFIASELVDGMTLRHHLARGRIKLREAIEIAIQVSSALVAAHEAGIVHRDIKPENIMVRRDGYVKVLDFGLAKLTLPLDDEDPAKTDEATVHRPTDPGTVMGTVHYMSPEQAKGRGVDARSDIFSLGVVLYEMITGKIPFEGETNSHIIVSILERQPVPIGRIVPDVPPELQRIVQKALAKERDERYQVVKDLLIDLKALRHDVEVAADLESGEHLLSVTQRTSTPPPATATGAARVSSAEYIISGIRKHKRGAFVTAGVIAAAILALVLIPLFTREAESGQRIPVAVADFDNQTGEPELDGLSGMLITSLEQSRRLAVLTRSRMLDALKLMGNEGVARIDESLGREVSQREGVRALVTASVQKFGGLYIVDLKVLDPIKNEYIFTAKEEGKGKESIPKLIDRLSEQVRLALKESERDVETSNRNIAEATTPNIEAYQHYFKGEEAIGQLHLEEAEQELQKAVAIDPSFGLAWYRLAYAQGWNGSPKAKESIDRAMRFIDRVPEKEQLMIRAEKATTDGRIRAAISLCNDALKRYPDEKEARYLAGDLSYHYGDYSTAKLYLRKVLDADPKHTRAYQHLIWTLRDLGEMKEAVAVGRRFLEVSPNDTAYAALLDALSASGHGDEANELARRANDLYPNHGSLPGQAAMIRAFYGDIAGARRDLDGYLSGSAPLGPRVNAIRALAMLDTFEGRFDRAMR
ncbi:MAG TPA: protein kinase, partial [Thermoanaerobaculia bacterium]